MWFKCDNIPLKWCEHPLCPSLMLTIVPIRRNLPLGVLYDLFGKGELPWRIEVNFQNFPANRLQRWESEDSLKAHFMNNLKEVCISVVYTDRR